MSPIAVTVRRLPATVRLAAAVWLVLAGSVGCRRADARVEAPRRYPLEVVCTTGLVADLVRNIGGPHVHVNSLMGSGVDPHLYKATPGDVRTLTQADVVVFSGLHLEGRLASLLDELRRRKPTFAVTDGLIVEHRQRLRHMPAAEAVHDPHVWFDVALWAHCARFAGGQLAALDPAHGAEYLAAANGYADELDRLDAECRRRLAEIPRPRRVLVTAHDAFGYFGAAYDVEVHGLQGMSTTAEADLGAVNELIDLLARRQIKAVFVESSVPAKNIRALVEGTAARGHRLQIGGELYSDALGAPGTAADSYAGMVRHNLSTIVESLR